MKTARIFPVIMAGGSGTRFWPLSRKARPKQFLPLATEKVLLADTFDRLKKVASAKDIRVVCGPSHAAAAKKHVKGLLGANLVIEPAARNTAPAIALACAHVAKVDPQGVVVVLPSDQHVQNVDRFAEALRQAVRVAEAGHIVTLGIRPTRPDTGFGYIRQGASLSDGANAVAAFVEKPKPEVAKEYLASGAYLWNAGIFVFRASVMLKAFETFMPELSKALGRIQEAIGTRAYPKTLAREFKKMPAISIDYGVAEKAPNMAVVPGDFGWSDVGSFNALPEVRPADARGNVLLGKGALAIECDGCVVLAKERPLAVVGMKEVVVVDTDDAVLVIPKEQSQKVRAVVDELGRRKWTKYL